MTSTFSYGVPPTESIIGAINADVTQYMDQVCAELEINVADVLGHSRQRQLVDLRHLFMYIMRHDFEMHYSEIGAFMGRHHATAIHGVKNIAKWIDTNQISIFLRHYLQVADKIFKELWGRNLKISSHGI